MKYDLIADLVVFVSLASFGRDRLARQMICGGWAAQWVAYHDHNLVWC